MDELFASKLSGGMLGEMLSNYSLEHEQELEHASVSKNEREQIEADQYDQREMEVEKKRLSNERESRIR
jgi:hypothetical protein